MRQWGKLVPASNKDNVPFIISVVPNPANEKAIVYYSGINVSLINVFSATGQLIRNEKIETEELFRVIDLVQLPNGVYILQAASKQGYSNNVKLIVLH